MHGRPPGHPSRAVTRASSTATRIDVAVGREPVPTSRPAGQGGGVTTVALVAGVPGVLGSLVAGRAILPDNGFTSAKGYEPLSLADGSTLRATLLCAFPIVAQLMSDPCWQQRLERYGPMEAGLSVQHTMRLDELAIGPWPGLGVLATYAGFALLSGLTLFQLRDA
jgi:ABC-2 type transport system permease protein